VTGWLKLSAAIDALNRRIGKTVYWLVLITVLVSAGNAIMRYTFNMSSNAWLEIQWYLFSAVFLLCAGYTFLHNEHIRIDIISNRMTKRGRDLLDIFGHLVFLLPLCLVMLYESWPYFMTAFRSGEISSNAGGLIRWPVRLLIPVGFMLLLLQMISELIKRIAAMRGLIADPHGDKSGAH
jgi:TRAP-type mannitol/chloroaromatic compound transport system permease small subunit